MAVVGEAQELVMRREKHVSKDESSYKRVYLVTCNKIEDDANVAGKAFGLPKMGFQYITETSVDKAAKVVDKAFKQLTLYDWEVEVSYSDKIDASSGDGQGGNKKGDNPIYEPPNIVWSGTNIREVVQGISKWRDVSNDTDELMCYDTSGILNSAKEPFIPPAEVDRWIPQCSFERNEESFNHRNMLLYVNSVNNKSWYGWKARMVKCCSINGKWQSKIVNGVRYDYWRVEYVFQFNKYTWDLFLLDVGTYYFDGGYSTAIAKKKLPFQIQGVPGVGLLTSSGDKSTQIVHFVRYRVLDKLNFHKLHIPLNW